MIWVGIILIVISAVSNAGMDTLAHHYEKSVFNRLNKYFWNPVDSGDNKWKDGIKARGEKYFLSSSLLVGFTEGWHLFKMLFLNLTILGTIMISIELYDKLNSHGYTKWEIVLFIMIYVRVIFGGVFTPMYNRVFKK